MKFEEGSRLAGIYEGAFFGCGKLKNIILADNIVEISDYAFYGCTSLTEIPVSDTSMIKGIYSYAFAYSGICGDFATPKTLIDIGDYAFRGTKITSAFIPDDNKLDLIIGIGVFEECEVMEKIDVPFLGASYGDEDIYWIGYIFGAGAPSANATYIPQSLRTYIAHEGGLLELTCGTPANIGSSKPTGYYKMEETNIENITLPEGITSIGQWAFYKCVNLKSVTIPDSVTNINSWAFYNCSSLESLTIPDSVKGIGNETFYNCKSLTSIKIPEGVTSIGNYTFHYCTGLTSITIPSSVTSIEKYAFVGCNNLFVIRNNSDLKFDMGSDSYGYIAKNAMMIYNSDGSIICKESKDGVPYYITSDGFAFSVENGEYILIKYIGNNETITLPLATNGKDYTVKMESTGKAKNVIIPSGITQINDNAFENCQNLTSITISDGVTSIGSSAFWNCRALVSITISDSVTNIGDSAFWNCSNLMSITIPNSVTSIGARAFYDCSSLKDVKLSNNITVISSLLFGRSGITSIIIPDSVTNIEIYTDMCAFYACESLEEIVVSAGNPYYKSAGNCIIDKNGTLVAGCGKSVIPDDGSVTRIGYQAFYGCGNIANITIPNSVTSIGARAFSGCSSVTNITIPDSVTSIEWKVFDASTHVEVDPNNPVIKDCGGAIFEGTALLHVNRDVESVTIKGQCNWRFYCSAIISAVFRLAESENLAR